MSFLQATPEKCIDDPVMMGLGNRKRVLSHASFGTDESVEEIVFEPVHPTVFCQKEDRCHWAAYGWSKFTMWTAHYVDGSLCGNLSLKKAQSLRWLVASRLHG